MAAAAQRRLDLPDEIWASIFTLIPDHHLEPLTLVCSQFLILTNHLKPILRLPPSYPTPPTLPALLRRFTGLRAIDASGFSGDLDHLVYLISRSGLRIEELDFSGQRHLPVRGLSRFGPGLRELKVLKCSKLGVLRGDDLVAVAEAIPWIEDLDISYPDNDCDFMEEIGVIRVGRSYLSDDAVREMSANLRDLTKINLSGNPFVSDRAIVAVATNCAKLREIVAVDCCFVSKIGIADAIGRSPNLASVSVSGMELAYSDSASIRASIRRARSLSALHFSYSSISDEFLRSVADARLPLKQLTVSNCFGFSLAGISTLISAYRGLTFLSCERVEGLTDEAMAGLAEFPPRLTYVNLNWCSNLGNLTLFAIIKCCSSIRQISMERTSLGKERVPSDTVFSVNPSMKSLKVARNSLDDECVTGIALACPSLEIFDLSQCWGITATGITGVLNICKEIRHLGLNQLSISGLEKWDKGKVEFLEMKGLVGLTDDELDMIGEGCPNLLSVDFSSCLNLSTAGVKRLVTKCSKLREMGLDWCEDMSFGNLASMVFQRRSLRKVVFGSNRSSNLLLSGEQKDVLFRHGCLVVQN
uniref:Uncharacterized protein n=1 Tax=Kalanchoe fedtschenkoi TaxID=63787 RepID=A0A7N0VCS3_KALFE